MDLQNLANRALETDGVPAPNGMSVELPPLAVTSTNPAAQNYNDVLAYYPARGRPSEALPTSDDALKYYIAKELQDSETGIVSKIQNFLDPNELGIPRIPGIARKRILIKSFLDKLQIVGDNISEDSLAYREWELFGEGLYMEFYFRHGSGEQVVFPPFRRDFADGLFRSDRGEDPVPGLLSDNNIFGLRLCIRDSYFHGGEEEYMVERKSAALQQALADTYGELGGSFSATERSYDSTKGFPIIEFEQEWGQLVLNIGTPTFMRNLDSGSSVHRAYEDGRNLKLILEYLKGEIIKQDDFRVMFEYVFPVKKMFNMLFLMMDQNVSAFLTNTNSRGVERYGLGSENNIYPMAGAVRTSDADGNPRIIKPDRFGVMNASSIDPEQFRNAKNLAKSILENVNNSSNYRYVDARTEQAGGIGRRALSGSLGGF